MLLEQAGVELPMWDAIDGRDHVLVEATIRNEGRSWRRVEAARTFDVVVMRGLWRGDDGLTRAGEIHCGVMALGSRVLHCERESDTVCVPLVKLMKRVTGIYRYGELEP